MCYPIIGLNFGEHHDLVCIYVLISGFLTIFIIAMLLLCFCPCTIYKICYQICSGKTRDEIMAAKQKKNEGKKRKKAYENEILRIKKAKDEELRIKKANEKKGEIYIKRKVTNNLHKEIELLL